MRNASRFNGHLSHSSSPSANPTKQSLWALDHKHHHTMTKYIQQKLHTPTHKHTHSLTHCLLRCQTIYFDANHYSPYANTIDQSLTLWTSGWTNITTNYPTQPNSRSITYTITIYSYVTTNISIYHSIPPKLLQGTNNTDIHHHRQHTPHHTTPHTAKYHIIKYSLTPATHIPHCEKTINPTAHTNSLHTLSHTISKQQHTITHTDTKHTRNNAHITHSLTHSQTKQNKTNLIKSKQ
ncbi:unnamed protein product [Heterobilharzia americana]|nr:unnamed protein product [Heterobilharzia americana]